MINRKLSCVYTVLYSVFLTGSQVVSGDADGCGKSCVHTIQEALCYSNALICQLGKSVCVEAV